MVKVDAQNMTIQQVEEAFCDKGRNSLFVFICSSYPDDEFVDNLKSFFSESASDWRFSKRIVFNKTYFSVTRKLFCFFASLFWYLI